MSNNQLKVFISYSHNDKKWLDRLKIHLKPLSREYNIDVWSDNKIKPGSKWKQEIATAVESCNVAVLLISADFLASDFIYTDELPPLLKAAENDGKLIISVIVSPCLLSLNPQLSEIQAINEPEKPLLSLLDNDQETVFVKVVEAIYNRSLEISTSKINTNIATTIDNHSHPEDFLKVNYWQKLIKHGNWMFDENNQTIFGSGVNTFLLSRQIYGHGEFEIQAKITYSNIKLFTKRLDYINTGILFGWESDKSKPTYYNLLFTGQKLLLERVGNMVTEFVEDNAKTENYEHIDKGVIFELQENFEYEFLIQFLKNEINVFVNNQLIKVFKLPGFIIGRVGLRAWRCQVNIHEFIIKNNN